jgi:hypothetical protein
VDGEEKETPAEQPSSAIAASKEYMEEFAADDRRVSGCGCEGFEHDESLCFGGIAAVFGSIFCYSIRGGITVTLQSGAYIVIYKAVHKFAGFGEATVGGGERNLKEGLQELGYTDLEAEKVLSYMEGIGEALAVWRAAAAPLFGDGSGWFRRVVLGW